MSSSPSSDDHDGDQPDLGLDQFESISDDQGLSLDELSTAYAELMGQGDNPFPEEESEEEQELGEEPAALAADDCEVSPQTILEAILFVGHPENTPLTAQEIAELMRGVRSNEIDGLICDLNETYDEEGCPYHIVSDGAGYRLTLRAEFGPLREKFYGRIREARLSQGAIDVLAVVAYNEGVTREKIDEIRGKSSAGLLSQMVRRQLLRMERPDEKPRRPRYYITPRFLHFFDLEQLEDLPRSPDFDGD